MTAEVRIKVLHHSKDLAVNVLLWPLIVLLMLLLRFHFPSLRLNPILLEFVQEVWEMQQVELDFIKALNNKGTKLMYFILLYTISSNLYSCFLEQVSPSLVPLLAAAAAKSLQSCPTRCDPIDGSPPGSPVPGPCLSIWLIRGGRNLTLFQNPKPNFVSLPNLYVFSPMSSKWFDLFWQINDF